MTALAGLASLVGLALMVIGGITAGWALLFGSGGTTDYRYRPAPAGISIGLVLIVLGAVLLAWAAPETGT